MQLILISGQSGSGKSVALRALEDSGFYCVDNLPATLLSDTLALYSDYGYEHIAISVDIRSSPSLGALPEEMAKLRVLGVDIRLLYFEAQDEVLVRRYSETRRCHPLSGSGLTLQECIYSEKMLLDGIQELGARIDTTHLLANNLRGWLKDFIAVDSRRLTLVLQSFGFKHGLPLDADFVFDVRCLPNPYYDENLRRLTGKEPAIIDFFQNEPLVNTMLNDIEQFIGRWLPAFSDENRSYLTIAIGCTGGQHRSVYIAEVLAGRLVTQQVLLRHRQLQHDDEPS